MTVDNFEEVTVSRRPIFKGKIIEVVVDDVKLPSGEMSQRELVFHNGAVGIMAVTSDDKIVLVEQFRKPLEKTVLEIPAGKIEIGETCYQERARRELEEETSYAAANWTLISKFATAPGFSNERLYLYEATQLKKVADPLPQDDDELIVCHELTLAEAKDAIKSGWIDDAKTIIAIQHWEIQSLKDK